MKQDRPPSGERFPGWRPFSWFYDVPGGDPAPGGFTQIRFPFSGPFASELQFANLIFAYTNQHLISENWLKMKVLSQNVTDKWTNFLHFLKKKPLLQKDLWYTICRPNFGQAESARESALADSLFCGRKQITARAPGGIPIGTEQYSWSEKRKLITRDW